MLKRPIQIIVVAILQFLSPITNLLIASYVNHATPWLIAHSAWLTLTPGGRFRFFFLGPLLGFSIYTIKRWSVPFAMICVVYMIYENVALWLHAPGHISAVATFGISFLNACLIVYLLLPPVRSFYFSRQLRWWESKPRYRATSTCTLIRNGERLPASIINVSLGGIYLDAHSPLEKGESIIVETNWETGSVTVAAEVVHKAPLGAALGCGLRFNHTRQTMQLTKKYLHQLEINKVPCSRTKRDWKREVTELKENLKHGKGWVPEVRKSSLNQHTPANLKK